MTIVNIAALLFIGLVAIGILRAIANRLDEKATLFFQWVSCVVLGAVLIQIPCGPLILIGGFCLVLAALLPLTHVVVLILTLFNQKPKPFSPNDRDWMQDFVEWTMTPSQVGKWRLAGKVVTTTTITLAAVFVSGIAWLEFFRP